MENFCEFSTKLPETGHCCEAFRPIFGQIRDVLTSGIYSPPSYFLHQQISAHSDGLNSGRQLLAVDGGFGDLNRARPVSSWAPLQGAHNPSKNRRIPPRETPRISFLMMFQAPCAKSATVDNHKIGVWFWAQSLHEL